MVTMPLDLWVVLAENVFGSIWLSGVGIMIAIFLIAIISKMSPMTIIWIEAAFLGIFGTGYFGSIFIGMYFIFGAIYFAWAILNFANTRKYYG